MGGVMKELKYESQGISTYLVYEVKDTDVVDSMSLGMLTNNKIAGLAQTIFTQMDDKQFIKFNVSSKVSVSQFFTGAVNKKRLLGVFKGITDAILASEDYMLDTGSMLLDFDYIFTDVSTCETIVICLPILDTENTQCDMKMFFRNVMFSTQFDQTENCDYVARLINYLNSTPVFSIADFKELVESLLNEQNVQSVTQTTLQTQAAQPKVETTVESRQALVEVQNVQPQAPRMQSVASEIINTPVAEQPKVEPAKSSINILVGNSTQPSLNGKEDVPSASSENQMTMFGLLRNFSKENMELYKAQKAAQKAAPKAEKVKDKGAKKNDKKKNASVSNSGFAIPGQATSSATVQVPETNSNVQSSTMTPTQAALYSSTTATSTVQQPTVQQPAVQQSTVQQSAVQQQPAAGKPLYGETTVLSASNIGETTVLSQVQNPMQPITPYLFRMKTNEKVMLEKPLFRIGKERSVVDYFIGDNTAISRWHAQIVQDSNEYYVMDMNSTNHTFVNGIMINSNEHIKLSDGDKIRFANEDFEFHLR